MTSPSSTPTGNDGGDRNTHNQMIDKAVRYAGVTLKDRLIMRRLIKNLDRYAAIEHETCVVPPGSFRRALRRPIGAKRTPVKVTIHGKPVSLLLNPQGRVDVEREQWLWDYIRDLVEGDEE